MQLCSVRYSKHNLYMTTVVVGYAAEGSTACTAVAMTKHPHLSIVLAAVAAAAPR
jgi:hypothetical protein